MLQKKDVKYSLLLVKLEEYCAKYGEINEFLNTLNPVRMIQSTIYPDRLNGSAYAKSLCKKDVNDIYSGSLPAEQFYTACERNSCWFQKIAVYFRRRRLTMSDGPEGKIGNIHKELFENIIKEKNKLSELWDLTRDHIEICKDCEYRYYCKDCRPLERSMSSSGSIKSRSNFCLYNPYTGEWGGQNGK